MKRSPVSPAGCARTACARHARINAHAGGQALTEFLVLAFALIPLFLLIPVIAKYQDIAHATQMASRYAAFDATVHNHGGNWKPEAQLASEIRRRFFSNSEAWIKTNDTAGNFHAHRNMFWHGPQGDALIPDIDNDVTLSFGRSEQPRHADAFVPTSDRGNYAQVADRIGLQTPGIYRANVSVRIANLPQGLTSYEPLDRIDLSMTRTSSVLIDPWTATDPDQTDERVYRITELNRLRSLAAEADAEVTPVELVGGIRGPRLGQLDFWHDLVPEDRLR